MIRKNLLTALTAAPLRYVTDRHVRFNVTLRFLTLRYVTLRYVTLREGGKHALVS